MRIVSLQPTATEILIGLGLADEVVGVSHECDLDRPRLVRSRIDSERRTSLEIDREMRALVEQGVSPYLVDEDQLRSLDPDVIFVQSVCDI